MIKIQDIPFAWARGEVEFSGEIRRGARGKPVRQVQEWLTYHRFPTSIDGGFGSATETVVKDFQKARGLRATGVVNEKTFGALVQPLMQALDPIPPGGKSFPQLVLAYARK